MRNFDYWKIIIRNIKERNIGAEKMQKIAARMQDNTKWTYKEICGNTKRNELFWQKIRVKYRKRNRKRERGGGASVQRASTIATTRTFVLAILMRRHRASAVHMWCLVRLYWPVSLLSPHFLSASRPALSPELFCNLPRWHTRACMTYVQARVSPAILPLPFSRHLYFRTCIPIYARGQVNSIIREKAEISASKAAIAFARSENIYGRAVLSFMRRARGAVVYWHWLARALKDLCCVYMRGVLHWYRLIFFFFLPFHPLCAVFPAYIISRTVSRFEKMKGFPCRVDCAFFFGYVVALFIHIWKLFREYCLPLQWVSSGF